MTSMWSDTKPIGHQHHPPHAVGGQLREVVVDVGLQPRRGRGARARAVDEVVPVGAAGRRLHPAGHLVDRAAVLADVRPAAARVLGVGGAAGVGHLGRDRVGDEDEAGGVAVVGQLGQRRQARVDDGLDEAGVVVVLPQPVEPRRTRGRGDRVEEVLAVLPARGPRRVRRRGEDRGAAHPVGDHRGERVGEVGVPVAVAEVDREVDALVGEVLLQGRDQRAVLVVDRAAAAEEEVVLPHLLEPLARDPPAPGHVLEERHHVLGLLRSPEGEHQERVVRLHVGVTRGIHGASVEAGPQRHSITSGVLGALVAQTARRSSTVRA